MVQLLMFAFYYINAGENSLPIEFSFWILSEVLNTAFLMLNHLSWSVSSFVLPDT